MSNVKGHGDFGMDIVSQMLAEAKDTGKVPNLNIVQSDTDSPELPDVDTSDFIAAVVQEGGWGDLGVEVGTVPERPKKQIIKEATKTEKVEEIEEEEAQYSVPMQDYVPSNDPAVLAARLNALIVEAHSILRQMDEMTTCGMIGTNQGAYKHPKVKKKKKGKESDKIVSRLKATTEAKSMSPTLKKLLDKHASH